MTPVCIEKPYPDLSGNRIGEIGRSSGTRPTRHSHYGHQDDRRAHHREHFAVTETSSASFAGGRTLQDWGQVRS
jgi:hypothetical protein